ncbi:alanine racemase [Desulfopila aestuarii]|uniref:Alanine racemase n=1 Tax=Desulfopila aestuarii DSM 18488 TaxID=1121416 RepID=A0A1M7XXI3_9BACT|nr:alanine racemase [Desulfopila aestuarii]SHO43498.1 alanine racemase [Desulfopila aestuarii DSM 18488]
MNYRTTHLTQASINLDHLSHNMHLLQKLAGNRPLFPAIKANAYGHGSEIIARHLIQLGYTTLCTAHISEAAELAERGIQATFIILSPTLPENSDYIIHYGFQPVVCSLEQLRALAEVASGQEKQVTIHVKVDTGMGRMGLYPEHVPAFLDECSQHHNIIVQGICSHFPRADENDHTFSQNQIDVFARLKKDTARHNIPLYHFANSAALFALQDAHFDAIRPGISIYGLKPSADMQLPELEKLKPVLSLKSRITFLKDVPAGTGISYGHTYSTENLARIATIPVGYGDGISRQLSNRLEVLACGVRCRQVGRICMDQCMIDVTPLGNSVSLGDEVVIIGNQGSETITADELAAKQETINYEIVTAISQRVPRIVDQ